MLGSSSIQGPGASNFFTRNNKKTLFMEGNLLPVLNSILYRYPPIFTVISVVIELLQCLAFALNPHNPGSYIAYSIIYYSHIPVFDGDFQLIGFPSYKTFTIYFIIISIVVAVCVVVFIASMIKTQFMIEKVVTGLGFAHVFNFMISIFLIPTIQTLLSGYICQVKPVVSAIERDSSTYDSGAVFVDHVVFFEKQSCTANDTRAIMIVSVILLLLWGVIALAMILTLIPVDREDASVRRRCSAHVDLLVFVYKVGLCVNFHMAYAFNVRGTAALVVGISSMIVAVAHGFALPYYAEWMNRLFTAGFAVIGWCGFAEYIAYRAPSQNFVNQGTIFIVLCVPAVAVGVCAWFLAGIRYNPLVKKLLYGATEEHFVSIDKNPFVLAFLQNNFDLLPFPKRLPTTDAYFSPYYSISIEILDEALREEDLMRRSGNAATEGEEGAALEKTENEAAAESADIRIAEALGMETEWNGVNIIAEASRRQVIAPTLTTAWIPTDAEACVRFLYDWQAETETFPSPHMICFASRIFNKAMLKWHRASIIMITYIGFLCDFAPSFARMSMCLDMIRAVSSDYSNDITETFLLYYFSLHVKMALGIRSSLHQEIFLRAKNLHQQTLLRTTLLWRSLQEEKRNIVTLYWFTSDLAQKRWECYNAYANALTNVVDDEILVRNVGLFYEIVYKFKKAGIICKLVAANLGQMQLMRLQRTFHDTGFVAEDDAEEEKDKQEQKEDGSQIDSQDSSRISSNLSASMGSSNTSSRVSSISSGGRSSQARSRNAKRAAELMVEKINEVTDDLYRKLQEHLKWNILSICSFAAFMLIVAVLIVNIIVIVIKFKEWDRLTNIIVGLSQTRSIIYLISVQLFRLSEMLPEVSYLLSSTQISNIQSNITFFRSIINAVESNAAEILYGQYSPMQKVTYQELTRVRNFARVYTTTDRYDEFRVSFVTHVTTVLSTARRLADMLDDLPDYATFSASPDFIMLSENLLTTMDSTFGELQANIQNAMRDFGLLTTIIFAIIAVVSIVVVCVSCYILLWNYRRAASVIASELRLFSYIPKESIKRLTVDTQKDMDDFALTAERSNVVASLLAEERKDATHASLVQSFGMSSDPHASSALLSKLLITRNMEVGPFGDDRQDESPFSREESEFIKRETSDGEKVSRGAAQSSAAHHLSEGHQEHSAPTGSAGHMERKRDAVEEAQEEFLVTGKKKHPHAFMLLNDFTYPDLQDGAVEVDKSRDDELDELLAAGMSLNEKKESATLTEFTWGRIIISSLVTLALLVAGLVFLIASVFSLNNVQDSVSGARTTLSCAQQMGNTTGNMLYYSAWFIARGEYEDFVLAQDAILDNTRVVRTCRSSLNITDFFVIRQEILQNTLIALSLVIHSIIGTDEDKLFSYPVVLNFTWNPLQQSQSLMSYLEPYLTQEELKAWVPYSSAAVDLALAPEDMKALGIETFFGSFGRGLTEVVVNWNRLMMIELVNLKRSAILESAGKLKVNLILAITFWGAAAVVSQLHLCSSSRKAPVLFALWTLFAVFSIIVAVLCGMCYLFMNRYLKDLDLWGNELGEVCSKNLMFLNTIAQFLGYPLVNSDVALLNLLNISSEEYIINFDNAFFPQPNSVYKTVDMAPYGAMVQTRNTFFHYAWICTVCAVYGHGGTSILASNPSIRYLRWNMTEDPYYEAYMPLYPDEGYLTTFDNDVKTDRAETLKLCRGAMTNHLMTDLASQVWTDQLAAGSLLITAYSEYGNATNVKVETALYSSFGCGAVALLSLFGVLITLTIYSVRAFSRTDDERMVHRAAFHSDGNKVIAISALILIGMVVVNGLGMYYSITVQNSLMVGSEVMKSRYINNCLLALSATLSSFSSYFEFMTLNLYFKDILSDLNGLIQASYLASGTAVSMSRARFNILFGTDKPFANFSSVSSDTLFATSCVDPTNSVSGNQQPILIQNAVLYDLMRIINNLPTSNTSKPNAYPELLTTAFEAMGPIEYGMYNTSASPLATVDAQRNRILIICIIILVVAIVATFMYYIFLLRSIVVKTKQQSIGTKLLLLGLPADILNTVPEIKEFYDPEAGSSDDQLKRKLQQSERLLQNILPPNISRRLKNGERVIADAHESVTVVFASLVGFEEYSAQFDARGLVHFLNGIIVAFDHIVDLLDLEKVKTIADVYFFCGGLTKKTERDHPIRCFECSLFFFQALEDHNSRHSTPNIQLRVGINTDAAVAGVIGNKKVAYDLWGDCVNTASRMYSTGVAGRIQVSDNTYQRVCNYYSFEDRHVQAKGKGDLLTHLYVDRIKNTAYSDLNWRVIS